MLAVESSGLFVVQAASSGYSIGEYTTSKDELGRQEKHHRSQVSDVGYVALLN